VVPGTRPFSGLFGGHIDPVENGTLTLVVIGASAGGVEPLKAVVAGLPPDLPAAISIALHVPASGSRLPDILSREGPFPAHHAADGDPLAVGHVYVAPPDRHLLVEGSRCVVVRGPRENGARPAIDPLFRSAAAAFGPRAVAVVLSGARSDGSAGAAAVAARGGTVIVQDPGEAVFPGMPSAAIERDHPDRVTPTAEIPAAVVAAVEKLPEEAGLRENGGEMSLEMRYLALDRDAIEETKPLGAPSAFSCPDCGGVLWEVDDGLHRFRCRVGHGYTDEAVLVEESKAVDNALWAAFRALHERADLSSRSARRSRERGANGIAGRFDAHAREALDQAELIRTILLERDVAGG
jgi:two-component system chemotaxis response regulator CheB